MLILTRKQNEAIQIGEDIEIKVLAIEGDQIKLGIEAPQSIEIHRKEIYLSIQDQNKEAADLTQDMVQLLNDQNP